MSRWLPAAAVVLALLGVVAYGLFRPGTDPGRDPADVQAKLDALPRVIGPWHTTADATLTDRSVATGGFKAYLGRTYTHETTKRAVAVLVLYGEAGDVAAHDPSICYAGTGYERCETPRKETIPGTHPPAELWAAGFRRKDETLAVYWGWAAGGDWRAADNPRFAFAGHRRIYKLYAQGAAADAPQSHSHTDPTAEFLPLFLPALADALPPAGTR